MKLATALILLLVSSAAFAATPETGSRAPVKKFRLPTFNQEGFRTSFLEGEEAVMVSPQRIEVKEMHYTVFSGDEKNLIETTLIAPVATVHVQEKSKITVQGESSVRLIRAEVDARGDSWSYDHANKRLSIGKNVRVIYRAVLKDLIK